MCVLFFKNLISRLGLCVGITLLFFTPLSVLAQTKSPGAILNLEVGRLLDLSSGFYNTLAQYERLEHRLISVNTLTSVTKHVDEMGGLGKKWYIEIAPQMKNKRKQILSYNATFQQKFNDMQQQIQNKNKEKILKILESIQSDIDIQKQGVTSFLTIAKIFRNDVSAISRQLQNDRNSIQVIIDMEEEKLGYPVIGENLLLNRIVDSVNYINGVNGGSEGVLSHLEAMNTNWMVLEAKLKNLIQNIKDTSDINMNFINADMKVIKENWDNIYRKTQQLYWEED
ncbi:HBL/NHE enterotoxin family protein [Bacillus cereus group sp. Bc256]|uniref:HBL/NHE enterotoxin family protein n=1 Tax=unclassified Bacillus cereus group TaxID=2750818 RepID=UPI001F5968DE|nr:MULTISPECIES: HBL/NHE enterotoxin family protein [unclassified Bacillus cereus group]MDA2141293.1 HBL/NHE enterotoxin family protein [Bacillus cereus group sp. Bc256]MDA2599104.1 HBL/NHE enterotoxin family protein [Bacillus cereus group sp. Bc061]